MILPSTSIDLGMVPQFGGDDSADHMALATLSSRMSLTKPWTGEVFGLGYMLLPWRIPVRQFRHAPVTYRGIVPGEFSKGIQYPRGAVLLYGDETITGTQPSAFRERNPLSYACNPLGSSC